MHPYHLKLLLAGPELGPSCTQLQDHKPRHSICVTLLIENCSQPAQPCTCLRHGQNLMFFLSSFQFFPLIETQILFPQARLFLLLWKRWWCISQIHRAQKRERWTVAGQFSSMPNPFIMSKRVNENLGRAYETALGRRVAGIRKALAQMCLGRVQ